MKTFSNFQRAIMNINGGPEIFQFFLIGTWPHYPENIREALTDLINGTSFAKKSRQ